MTLIEVLIVVAIIAMVAGAASVGGLKAWESAVKKTALGDARAVRNAVKTYWLNEAEVDCPSVEHLISVGVLDKYGRKADPWGQPWKIECVEGDVIVKSPGKDKHFGTDDDVSAPSK